MRGRCYNASRMTEPCVVKLKFRSGISIMFFTNTITHSNDIAKSRNVRRGTKQRPWSARAPHRDPRFNVGSASTVDGFGVKL